MQTFETGRARLKVRNASGDVRVRTDDSSETTVELVPLNDSDATRQAIEKARVEARGDEVSVEVEGRNWSISIGSWGIGSPRVGVTITCPHGSDLECDTAAADVTAEGSLREVRLRTASGDLSLATVEGTLQAKSASGSLRVERVEGRAELHTVSGNALVLTALDGLAVNSVSGNVEVGEITGPLTVSSVSGDQRVRAAGPGEMTLKAVSGDVEVALRRGLRVKLDVNSVSGKIGSDLEVSDSPSAGDGPEVGLRVRTVSGDVKIMRAAAATK